MSILVDRLHRWVSEEASDLPLPGRGLTGERWRVLTALGREDTVLGRFAEAHADALAILDELDGPEPKRETVWGVWAAEPPSPVLEAKPSGQDWVLSGVKPWCSGAGVCTDALVTARVADESRLFAVDLTQNGCAPIPDTWHAVGMSRSDSGSVRFDDARAVAVGDVGSYVGRPGFWHGAVGVAAVWLGSAYAVADVLHAAAATGTRRDPHTLAHLGAVAAALSSASTALSAAAAEIDADPTDSSGRGRIRARILRATVERAASETIDRVGRALGAAPLCADGDHARRVADLTVYLRQSHAERDLAALGDDLAEEDHLW